MTPSGDSRSANVIDQLYDRFEADWLAGRRPEIENFLAEAPQADRGDLLRELMELEVGLRQRLGERVQATEYVRRFPAHKQAVDAVFFKPQPELPADPSDSHTGEIRLTLTVTSGPEKGRMFTFTGHDVFLAGRSKQTTLQLQDAYFSRYHFLIEINPPECRLTDTESRNKTYVNGQQVQSCELHDGDEIKVGQTTLRVIIAGPAVAGPAANDATEASTLALPAAEVKKNTDATKTPQSMNATVQSSQLPQQPSAGVTRKKDSTVKPRPQLSLDGYEVLECLGQGGMGEVYRARNLADGRIVAIKAINPAAAVGSAPLRRFLREAIILCQLDHPRIVKFHELLQVGQRPFIIMEYVQGQDAATILKQRGPLSVRSAVRMTLHMLSALEYAHRRGFVHRDIKPANLLVIEQGGSRNVKLTDFGLARVYQESRLSGLTLHGDIGGTLPFMPPEQIKNFRKVKPAADQYSAAATLYNLLTNKLLFEVTGKPTQHVLSKVLQDAPLPLESRRTDLPEKLAAVVHRALAKEPGDRFADVRAFRMALRPFAE